MKIIYAIVKHIVIIYVIVINYKTLYVVNGKFNFWGDIFKRFNVHKNVYIH